MAHVRVLSSLLSAIVLVSAPLARAQDASIGALEFMNSCAQCHGPAGQGDGVMSGFLNKAAPDLTGLQKANGGVFPFARVYGVIDGSVTVGAHGTVDMPAWGQRYAAKAPAALGYEYGREDEAAFVRGRILALAEFVATLQSE